MLNRLKLLVLRSLCILFAFAALTRGATALEYDPETVSDGPPEAPQPENGDEVIALQMAKLTEAAESPAFLAAIQALTPIYAQSAPVRFSAFRHHTSNKSRLNAEEQTAPPPEGSVIPDSSVFAIVEQVLNAAGKHAGMSPIADELMARMSRVQYWRLLESAELVRHFGVAVALGRRLHATEPDQDLKGLLALVTARNLWLGTAGDPGAEYESLLAEALEGTHQLVRADAELWAKAVSAPDTYESFILGHHVWETVHLDLSQREKSGRLTRMLSNNSQPLYEQVKNSTLGDTVKQYQMGRILSIASESAFQGHRRSLLNWARTEAYSLGQGALIEDKMAPAYFHAYDLYSGSDFVGAIEGFQSLFLSDIPCDISASAGAMVVTCCQHLSDDVGAFATMQLLHELYPAQDYILNQVSSLKEFMNSQNKVTEVASKSYIKEHYERRLQLARSQRGGERPTQLQQAKSPGEPKKVAAADH